MATMMIKSAFLIVLTVTWAIHGCTAQVTINTSKEEILAKKVITSSRFGEFLNYDANIKQFLTTGLGNLEYGPTGIIVYIHESVHFYDIMKSAFGNSKLYYWVDSSVLLKVDIIKGYVTSEKILSMLPPFLKEKNRTKTYLTCDNNCVSRKYGIYGLLEEFNAYSTGPRALVGMYNFFDTCTYTNNSKFWNGYLNAKYEGWLNFYYFNISFHVFEVC